MKEGVLALAASTECNKCSIAKLTGAIDPGNNIVAN